MTILERLNIVIIHLLIGLKMADLEDNMDLSRLENVTDKDKERVKRYKKAVDILFGNCD